MNLLLKISRQFKELVERTKTERESAPDEGFFDVCMIADKNFFPYTCVTFASVLSHLKTSRTIRFFLITNDNIDAPSLAAFEDLKKIQTFHFFPILSSSEGFRGLKTTEGISDATYLRLRMPELLPLNCTTVLYLDSDLVVVDNFCTEYEDFIAKKQVIAGVEDGSSLVYKKRYGQSRKAKHINAGVILLNLDLLRKANFSKVINLFCESRKYTLNLGDQEIINFICGDIISYLHPRWNLHGRMHEKAWRSTLVGRDNEMNIQEVEEAHTSPGIVHFTYKRKPWTGYKHPFSSLWFEAAQKTVYRKKFK